MQHAIQVLTAFGQIKKLLEETDKRSRTKGKKPEPSPEEVKWMNEMNGVMIDLRDEFIRTSNLKVTQLCEIFGLSNQRIYQIRGKQAKKAA
jgi:hypothetical protein